MCGCMPNVMKGHENVVICQFEMLNFVILVWKFKKKKERFLSPFVSEFSMIHLTFGWSADDSNILPGFQFETFHMDGGRLSVCSP